MNEEDFTKNKVKKAFHKMALVWHPDKADGGMKHCFANKE